MNEQADIISTVMMNMKVPEHLQRRVLDYYDEVLEYRLIWSEEFFNYLSPTGIEFIKQYQIEKTVHKLSFMGRKNKKDIDKLLLNLEHSFYLPNDIIIKQGYFNDNFYFIHQGLIEVIQHTCDYMFFDYQEVKSKFEGKKKPKEVVRKAHSETKVEEGSFYENHPTNSQMFKRQTSQAFQFNKSTHDLDEISSIPDGSIISDISLVK